MLGERLFNVGFGSILPVQVFSQLNFNQAEQLLNELVRSINIWESRVEVVEDQIKVNIDTQNNSMVLVIPYIIKRNGFTGTFSRKITI